MKSMASVSRRLALLSVHPEFADKILTGEKTVELRRRRLRLALGDALLLYSTLPCGNLVGLAWVDSVVALPTATLWHRVANCARVDRARFNAYFSGRSEGVGIFLVNPIRFRQPIPLWRMRKIWPGFHPPQTIRFFNWDDTEALGLPELTVALSRRAA